MQQAVLQARGLDLDMLGKLETALKAAAGNALVQQRRGGLFGLVTLAADGQDTVLHVHGKLLFGKAGDRQSDAVIVFVAALDVVGRIALLGRGFQKTEQPVKAYGGTEKGGIIDTHETTS